jgi:hypothetical protein
MVQRTTVEQLQQAVPRKGVDAPERARTHYERILALLRERGAVGVLASEMYDAPRFYGRSPRNRISELRQDGHLISGEPDGASDWRYILLRENEHGREQKPPIKRTEQTPLPAPVACSPGDVPARAVDSADWYVQQTGKPRPSVNQESLFLWERRQ